LEVDLRIRPEGKAFDRRDEPKEKGGRRKRGGGGVFSRRFDGREGEVPYWKSWTPR